MLMFIFASIQDAMFKLQVEGKNVHGPFKMQADFALEDTERMGLYLRQFQEQAVWTSSSIDFPEEDGAPEGFDAREKLENAMQFAWS